MIPGITEEDEDEDDMEDLEVEEVDHFGPELVLPSDVEGAVDDSGETYTEPVSPLSPLPPPERAETPDSRRPSSSGVPLTAEALAKMNEEESKKEKHVALS